MVEQAKDREAHHQSFPPILLRDPAGMMLSCLIIGDSLALGIGMAVNRLRDTPCQVSAQIGARSIAIAERARVSPAAGTILVSAGSNDARDPLLETYLRRVRRHLKARRVLWIYPYDRQSAAIVAKVAVQFEDRIVDSAQFATHDGIHPARYQDLARYLLRRRPEGNADDLRSALPDIGYALGFLDQRTLNSLPHKPCGALCRIDRTSG